MPRKSTRIQRNGATRAGKVPVTCRKCRKVIAWVMVKNSAQRRDALERVEVPELPSELWFWDNLYVQPVKGNDQDTGITNPDLASFRVRFHCQCGADWRPSLVAFGTAWSRAYSNGGRSPIVAGEAIG